MSLTRVGGLTLMLLLCGTAVGCNQAEKQQIEALTRQNQDLIARNGELQQQLATAQRDADNLRTQLAAKDQQIADLQRKGPGAAATGNTGPVATGWERGLTGDRVTLGTDILFAPGSATLSSAGEKELTKIAADLKKEYAGLRVRIYGYTDSDPILRTKRLWMDNLDLSLNRSAAVARYLWGKGVGKDRIETIGMGDTNFAASNSSKANKAKNRRVEIIVVKTK